MAATHNVWNPHYGLILKYRFMGDNIKS